MNLGRLVLAFSIVALSAAFLSGPAFAERTMFLNLCQELVNQARAYESRANYHKNSAKIIMMQIESQSRMSQNQATMQMIDTLFSQYDEHRALERKCRDLYRRIAEEADKCMQSAE